MIQKLDEGLHLITGVGGCNEKGMIIFTNHGATFFVEYTDFPGTAQGMIHRADFNFNDYGIKESDIFGLPLPPEIVPLKEYFERMSEPPEVKKE